MTLTPELGRWGPLVAGRARGGGDEGIAFVLGLLGVPGLISFAGGFPDPATFPRERVAALFQEFAASGRVEAFQYAPTRGLAGPLDALAGRIEQLQGRRPDDDELLITSGAIEALELVAKSFLDPGDLVVVEGPTYLGAIMAFRSFEADARRRAAGRATASTWTTSSAASRAACARSCSTRSPTIRTRPASASPSSAARRSSSSRGRYGFLIVEDVAYRELGFRRVRCRASGASRPTSSCRPARPRRRSSPASGSAGPSGRRRCPRS